MKTYVNPAVVKIEGELTRDQFADGFGKASGQFLKDLMKSVLEGNNVKDSTETVSCTTCKVHSSRKADLQKAELLTDLSVDRFDFDNSGITVIFDNTIPFKKMHWEKHFV